MTIVFENKNGNQLMLPHNVQDEYKFKYIKKMMMTARLIPSLSAYNEHGNMFNHFFFILIYSIHHGVNFYKNKLVLIRFHK